MKRICEHCGKPITFGCMTNDYGDFYIHEECFEDWMNAKYGVHHWIITDKGYNIGYEILVNNDWESIDIYYTEYESEDLEDEE